VSTVISPSVPTRRPSSGKATIRRSPKKITYRELHAEVCRMANALKELGVKKGDRVTIYLPMIPEAAYAMLACTRSRRGPFDRVRRLLARQPRQPASSTATATSWSPPTRVCALASPYRSRPIATRR
jgi:hypothetical protein